MKILLKPKYFVLVAKARKAANWFLQKRLVSNEALSPIVRIKCVTKAFAQPK